MTVGSGDYAPAPNGDFILASAMSMDRDIDRFDAAGNRKWRAGQNALTTAVDAAGNVYLAQG